MGCKSGCAGLSWIGTSHLKAEHAYPWCQRRVYLLSVGSTLPGATCVPLLLRLLGQLSPLNLCLHPWAQNRPLSPCSSWLLLPCLLLSFHPSSMWKSPLVAHGLAQQALCWPRALTAQLATASFTDLTYFSLSWPQITKNKLLCRGCRAPAPAGQQHHAVLCTAGAAPAWQSREKLQEFVQRQLFRAPSVAPFSVPLVVPRPLLPGEERQRGGWK